MAFEKWINYMTPKTWGERTGASGSSESLQVLGDAILTGVAASQLKDDQKYFIINLARAVLKMMFNFVDIVI